MLTSSWGGAAPASGPRTSAAQEDGRTVDQVHEPVWPDHVDGQIVRADRRPMEARQWYWAPRPAGPYGAASMTSGRQAAARDGDERQRGKEEEEGPHRGGEARWNTEAAGGTRVERLGVAALREEVERRCASRIRGGVRRRGVTWRRREKKRKAHAPAETDVQRVSGNGKWWPRFFLSMQSRGRRRHRAGWTGVAAGGGKRQWRLGFLVGWCFGGGFGEEADLWGAVGVARYGWRTPARRRFAGSGQKR